ncbi:MAG: lysylphosphatidylglycerol synthase transmembrane domain-containing protein [Fidelibacterota bacterium]
MNKLLKLVISLIISFAGLYYAFRKVEFSELLFHLKMINVWYILISLLLIVFSVAVRAERWQILLEPIEVIPFTRLFSSTMIGYFGNGVLPFRLGEVLRAYSLSEKTDVRATAAFGTIMLERILDVVGLIGMIILFSIFYPYNNWGNGILIPLVVVVTGILGFFIFLAFAPVDFMEKIGRWKLFKISLFHRIFVLVKSLMEGLTAIRQTKHVGQIIIHTIFLWLIYYIMIFATVKATNLDLGPIGVGIVLITTSLAVSIPAAPGYIGTYHATAVYILTNLFNTGLYESQAFAVIIHAVGFIPLVIIGAIYFFRSSLHLKDISGRHITE